ncbi:hypothetical protein GCM10023210_42470 [Chryseobacterium ginsengisoli]|uniref:Uncharacterized protein n=1 Tax=Chryseobacterium ginsengisoli TaxID=363853 RepID=A0ABP9MYJ2_9FLAO
MDIDKYLSNYSNPKIHPQIIRLTNEQKIRIKRFIDEIIEKTGREFEISELKILNDRIEIGINYRLSMF